MSDFSYIRFLHNTGDIIFRNGESPEFKAGQIIAVVDVEPTPSGGYYAKIDWGCGQVSNIYSKIEKFEILDPLFVLALVADGQLILDGDGTVLNGTD